MQFILKVDLKGSHINDFATVRDALSMTVEALRYHDPPKPWDSDLINSSDGELVGMWSVEP